MAVSLNIQSIKRFLARSIPIMLLMTIAQNSPQAKVLFHTLPDGYPRSNEYMLYVNDQKCEVYNTRVFFELNNQNRVVAFSQFDFTNSVVLRVEVKKKIESVRIRPLSLGIVPKIKGQSITFSLQKPTQISVEINGGIDDNLHIFANRPETDVPSSNDSNVLYYGPGFHYVDGGYGILTLKSNQTLYLASGAVLRARILAENASNIKVRGRGVLEGTTLLGRHPGYYRKFLGEPDDLKRPHFFHFQNCKDILVEGIIFNDPPCWCLVFNNCENGVIRNVKQFGYVDNSDGIDIVSCRNILIEDVFSRINDDCIVLKSGKHINTKDIQVRNCVLWSDRAQALQIGHETISDSISDIVFRDIDVLEQRNRYMGHYAIGIFNGDDAIVSNVVFDDIRVENSERLIGLHTEKGVFNRSQKLGRIENVLFKKINSGTTADLHIYGTDTSSDVRNVVIEDLRVNGAIVEPELFANLHAHDIVFKQNGSVVKKIASIVKPNIKYIPIDIGPVCNRSRIDEVAGDKNGWLDRGPELDMKEIRGGVQTLGGVSFHVPDDPEKGAIILRSSQHLVDQPYWSYPIKINQKADHLFFLQGTAFVDTYVDKVPPVDVWIGKAGVLRFNQSKISTPLWYYRVRYQDDGTEITIPVKAGWNVEDWEIWAPGGWRVELNGKKFYIQQWDNPFPNKPIDYVKVETALQPEVPIVLGVTVGVY